MSKKDGSSLYEKWKEEKKRREEMKKDPLSEEEKKRREEKKKRKLSQQKFEDALVKIQNIKKNNHCKQVRKVKPRVVVQGSEEWPFSL